MLCCTLIVWVRFCSLQHYSRPTLSKCISTVFLKYWSVRCYYCIMHLPGPIVGEEVSVIILFTFRVNIYNALCILYTIRKAYGYYTSKLSFTAELGGGLSVLLMKETLRNGYPLWLQRKLSQKPTELCKVLFKHTWYTQPKRTRRVVYTVNGYVC